jgi:hypothetical protein
LCDALCVPLSRPSPLVPRHVLDGLQRAAPHERPEAAEQPLLLLGEQVVAPADGVAEGLLPLRQVSRAAGQEREAPAQPPEHRLGVQQPDPGRRQLDGQRQAVQPLADLGDGRRVLGGDGEVWPDLPRPLREQRDGGVLLDPLGQDRLPRGRQGQRRDRILALAAHPKGRPAGHQRRQPRTGR